MKFFAGATHAGRSRVREVIRVTLKMPLIYIKALNNVVIIHNNRVRVVSLYLISSISRCSLRTEKFELRSLKFKNQFPFKSYNLKYIPNADLGLKCLGADKVTVTLAFCVFMSAFLFKYDVFRLIYDLFIF
jgi:hypothetical protein